MALFCGFLLVAAILYICGEFLQLDMTIWDSPSRGVQFVCSTLMILLTIGLLPLSLRLFKFKPVSADLLRRKAPALARWGTIRLVCMGMLLVVNTFLYYAFGFEASYGYLAVVTLLCMPFVVPTMGRCESEVKDPPTVPEGASVVQQSDDETIVSPSVDERGTSVDERGAERAI